MSGRYSDSAQDQSEYDEETYDGQGESYRDGSAAGDDTEEGDAPYAEDNGSQDDEDDDSAEDGSGSEDEDESEEGSDEASYDDEYDEEAYAEDHYTEKEYEEEGRSLFWLWCLCCCCLLLIILAILLGILLPHKKAKEIAPTMAPTFFGGNGKSQT